VRRDFRIDGLGFIVLISMYQDFLIRKEGKRWALPR
jgi:hypothetical protein